MCPVAVLAVFISSIRQILVSQGTTAALIGRTKTSIQRKEQWVDTYQTALK